MKPGWWEANVDPALNASQVLELVERDAPGHPALPRLRRAAAGFGKARQGQPAMFRCPRCKDTGWVELAVGASYMSDGGTERTVTQSHAGTVRRCQGPRSAGCPHEAHRTAKKQGGDAPRETRYS